MVKQPVCETFLVCMLSHSLEVPRFVIAKMENREVIILSKNGKQFVEIGDLLFVSFGPQRIPFLFGFRCDQQADMVYKLSFRIAFQIDVDMYRAVRQLRGADNVDLSFPNCQSLEGEGMRVAQVFASLAPATGTVSV